MKFQLRWPTSKYIAWRGFGAKFSKAPTDHHNGVSEALERPGRAIEASAANEEGRQAIHLECPLDLRRNQIRLLQIYPDAWNEPIRCGFQVVSLDESPSYVALSYVWGRGEENCVVTVDGKVVHVKPNLYAALRRLRAHSREDNIWVDALCIDQACTRERNHQVRIMGQIYSKCREVLVWMGELETAWVFWPESKIEPELGRCYDFCTEEAAAKHFQYRKDKIIETRRVDWHELERFPESEILLHMACFLHSVAHGDEFDPKLPAWGSDWKGARKEHFYKTLYEIQYNEWFKRLWVVQEIVLAPLAQVMFGPVILPLETLLKARERYDKYTTQGLWLATTKLGPARRLLEGGIEEFTAMAFLRDQISSKGKSSTVFELRLSLRRRSVSVDLDQIYSLLGLMSDSKGVIEPNYDLSAEEVYTAVSKQHINITQSLLPLSLLVKDLSRLNIPSWAVDWSQCAAEYAGYDFRAWTKLQSIFHASRGLEHFVGPYVSGKCLYLDGYFADNITFVGAKFQAHAINGLITKMANTNAFGIGNTARRLGWTPWQREVVRALCVDSYWPSSFSYNNSPQRLSKEQVDTILDRMGELLFSHLDAEIPYLDQTDSQLLPTQNTLDDLAFWNVQKSVEYVLGNVTLGHQMFTTKKGYIGLGSGTCKAGDTIFIAKGSSMPLVLRDPDSRIHRLWEQESMQTVQIETAFRGCLIYEAHGDCYLSGFMDGKGSTDAVKYSMMDRIPGEIRII